MTCEQLKMDLALSAIGALDEPRSAQVRRHVQTCKGCAERLREYEAVCAGQMTAADEVNELQVRGVSISVPEHSQPSALKQLRRWLAPVAGLGATAAVVVILFQLLAPVRDVSPPEIIVVPRPSPQRVMAVATLGSYRHALTGEGAASLDSLLERDADVLLRPASLRELQTLAEERF